jgi:hypothetical protein
MEHLQEISNVETARSPKKRDSNLELFRIITMMFIVAHHYVINSGLIGIDGPIERSPLSSRSLFLLLFGAWGKIGINCFVMITGYFMCRSHITAKKFAKLVCEFMFYRIIFYLIFLLSGYEPFSLGTFVKAIIPITKASTNFTGCFIIFWLFIPFLNILIGHLNERQHIKLMILSFFLYVLLGTVHQVTINYVSWFIVLYFVASYLRLYPKKCFTDTKLWGIIALCSVALSAVSVVACTLLGAKINRFMPYIFVSDSNTFLAFTTGVSVFMFFKNVKLNYNKLINTAGASTFGVLCIHANSDTMRRWLWKETLDNVGNYDSFFMPLHAIGSVIGIFAVCVVIDILRIRFIETPFFQKIWEKHWDRIRSGYHLFEDKFCNKLNIE